MASTYMTNYRQTRQAERDREIASEERACRNDVDKLTHSIAAHKKWSDYLKPTGCASAIVGFLLFCLLGPFSIIFALLLWPILNFIIVPQKNQEIDNANSEIRGQIAARERACREQCEAYKVDCERDIRLEESHYKSQVSQARKMYGGSTVMTPVVKWMCDRFEPNIRAADRGIYVKTITAELRYRVDSDQLVVLKGLPHSGTYYSSETVNFDKGIGGYRYHNLPDLFHQVGFAQALAKQIEFEIKQKYPQDPIAPCSGYIPKISIDYDDCSMVITYTVNNPNYRSQISFGTGVNS